MQQIDFIIPDHYLCYFVNGDIEGLTPSEINKVSQFEQRLIKQYGHAMLSYTGIELGFKNCNDIDSFGDNCEIMSLLFN